jgi:hypothetical protein
MATDKEKFLAQARKRFEQDIADEKDLREEYSKNVRFEAGEQWDPAVKEARIKSGRPALTFPRCHTFSQKVANEARQNKAEIKFSPAEPGDDDTVEILEGIARQIQYSSDADVAYETAAECQAGGNFGYFRFLTEYCLDGQDALENPERAGDQEIKVVPVFDPLSIYGVLIPTCYGQEPNHAFVIERMKKDEYIAEYGKTVAAVSWNEYAADKAYSNWVQEDEIVVAEYWHVEEETTELELPDGRTRQVSLKKVKFCKINGVEVIPGTETEWVTYCIPIFAVLGKLKFVDGKPRLFGVISHQLGSQQLINLYKSRIAETIGTAPIQPYMVPKGAITPDLRAQWEGLNSVQRPYVEYNVIDHLGKPIPPPQRQVFEPPIGALSEAASQEIDGMKAAAGIFDASLGNRGNETSGKAINARQQESDDVNAHIIGNFGRALEAAGKKVLAPAIRKIYDAPRAQRILGKDMTPKIVKINQEFEENGQLKHYKVGDDTVKYDAIVTVGRGFSSKKMESFDMYVQLGQTNPQMAFATSDLMLRNSDMAGADEAAERMKKIIYAQFPFLAEGEDENQQPIPPQVQAAMQQMQQQLEAMNAYAQQKEQELKDAQHGIPVKMKELDIKRELEMGRLQLEHRKLDAQVGMKAEELHSRESETIFKAEVDLQKNAQNLDAQAAAAEASQAAESM